MVRREVGNNAGVVHGGLHVEEDERELRGQDNGGGKADSVIVVYRVRRNRT